MSPPAPPRCGWAASPAAVAYHDAEWGVPARDERRLFEMLVLEGAQAGLSWETILAKRGRYREVFAGFDPEAVAGFGPQDVERLLADPGIVRNRAKVESAVTNARAVLAIREAEGSFAEWIWGVAGGRRDGARGGRSEVPAATPESEAMSRALKARGFRFVGPVTCYAFMQATGMVNDHVIDCFRHAEIEAAEANGRRET